ncbi:sphingosine-1-phosphate lyase domain protein [Burkholderia pseudomallei MSHR7498]|nr:pyridoxal-dependent decarboxylase domain protein [Burkholderia pseudomallei MSHR5492]KGS74190.1 sphingosine-1-phosphate lyase domain protein [Burkholderia pseudomallei MSHR7334]KGS91961.1 sphingosine-1-phosphate lyase domain protein [Burkholderia pseudomallei MSHR7498]
MHAEPTSITVFASTASRTKSASTCIVTGSIGATVTSKPNRCAALRNTGCADAGQIIRGRSMPRSARAFSRYASVAPRMLSVPPSVIMPHARCPGWCAATASPCSIATVMPTISLSIRFMLGHMSRRSALT